MTVRAPVGEINVVDGDYCAGRGVAIVRGRRPAYTEQLMRYLEPSWREHETGTIYPSVNRAQIVSLPAPKPADAAIETFEVRARPVYDLIGALATEQARLSAIRDKLLPKLVSGAIRVPDSYDPDDALGTVAAAAGVAVP
jgi:type I restriction enzyme S subunit